MELVTIPRYKTLESTVQTIELRGLVDNLRFYTRFGQPLAVMLINRDGAAVNPAVHSIGEKPRRVTTLAGFNAKYETYQDMSIANGPFNIVSPDGPVGIITYDEVNLLLTNDDSTILRYDPFH